jgi:hypothetical protein
MPSDGEKAAEAGFGLKPLALLRNNIKKGMVESRNTRTAMGTTRLRRKFDGLSIFGGI